MKSWATPYKNYKKIAHLLANALADLTMWLNVLGIFPAHSYPVADMGIIDEIWILVIYRVSGQAA